MSGSNAVSENEGGSGEVWKAVGIGLGLGVAAVLGTVAVVASRIADNEGLSGGALITSTLASIGGGSIESGGEGMVGGLINLCIIGGSGVLVGSAGSVLHDTISKSTRDTFDNYL